MFFPRPDYLLVPTLARASNPVQRPSQALAGLGELLTGGGSSNGSGMFRTFCEQLIGRFGQGALANVRNTYDLGSFLGVCSAIIRLGQDGNLPQDQQAAFDSFKASASPNDSPDNIYWMFAVNLSAASGRLAAAFRAQLGETGYGWWDDADASACNYVLMDTSSTGTTWYGGTTVQSRLTNDQWGTLFIKGWNVLVNGIANGVLPLTYLTAFLKGMLAPPVQRRLVSFYPAPSGVDSQDPRAIAFRTAMRQIGWGSITQYWFECTMQAWVQDDQAFQAQDKAYASTITALSYMTGAAILDKIRSKTDEYWKARSDAVQSINDFYRMLADPDMGPNVPEGDRAAMDAIKQQFISEDTSAKASLEKMGLWDDAQPRLNGLDGVQLVVAGVAAIGALGILAYIVSMMTETSRSAAAQTKATADAVLATVKAVKDSCRNVYDASDKTEMDELEYQDCLSKTTAMVAAIPKPPEGSDPLGLKSVALVMSVGLAAYLAVKLLPKKSASSTPAT